MTAVLKAPRARRHSRFTMTHQRWITAYLMVAPAVVLAAVFIAWPLLEGIWLSFHQWDGLSSSIPWVGLRNYENALTDPIFWGAIKNTFIYAFGVTIAKNLLGLVIAVLLNRKLRFKGLFRTATFIPVVMSFVVVGVLWTWIFNPDFGLLDSMLHALHMDWAITGWLSNPSVALLSIMWVDVWKWTGFHVVILLAGLQGIPEELTEAAQLDGAGRIRIFWNITIPMLRPVLAFSVLLSLVGAFVSNYDLVNVMTAGGPAHATEVALTWITTTTFTTLDIGKANAMSMILFVFVALFGILQLWIMTRGRRAQL
jgi:raffinose/stachyose/melibiose transport system permease protein